MEDKLIKELEACELRQHEDGDYYIKLMSCTDRIDYDWLADIVSDAQREIENQ